MNKSGTYLSVDKSTVTRKLLDVDKKLSEYENLWNQYCDSGDMSLAEDSGERFHEALDLLMECLGDIFGCDSIQGLLKCVDNFFIEWEYAKTILKQLEYVKRANNPSPEGQVFPGKLMGYLVVDHYLSVAVMKLRVAVTNSLDRYNPRKNTFTQDGKPCCIAQQIKASDFKVCMITYGIAIGRHQKECKELVDQLHYLGRLGEMTETMSEGDRALIISVMGS